MTVQEFIAKWRQVELKERSAAQEHFLDLCNGFEHPTPAAADPTGETYWFEKARAHIAAGKCKRAGLLSTQGIRGGANREVLKRIKDGGGIFWAESDRPWILDGANVHVSMVGFDI